MQTQGAWSVGQAPRQPFSLDRCCTSPPGPGPRTVTRDGYGPLVGSRQVRLVDIAQETSDIIATTPSQSGLLNRRPSLSLTPE